MTASAQRISRRGRRRTALIVGVIAIVFAGIAWMLINMLQSPPARPKPMVHAITLLPPPPPPKIEQKPPEPEIKEEVKLPEPEPMPQNDAPPPGDLGLDADGSGGADGFRLQARKGGRSLLAAGSPFGWYADKIQDHLYEALARDKKIRTANYVVKLKLWFAPDGRVDRFDLLNSTGDRELDGAIRSVLAQVARMPAPPADMPQPMVLRVTSRK